MLAGHAKGYSNSSCAVSDAGATVSFFLGFAVGAAGSLSLIHI